MRVAFLGSSLVSSYWNGAATYYRGLIAALSRLGFECTFYEPDAYDRQRHRDMEPPPWCKVVVYPATLEAARTACRAALAADVTVKCSGIGVFDDEIVEAIAAPHGQSPIRLLLDVDAPATLAQIGPEAAHPLRRALTHLDAVLTYGGGPPVVSRYAALGARLCVPIYNALDPSTHFPVEADPRFEADLAFLGNRLPDREQRVDQFFTSVARAMPSRSFLLAGAGWEPHALPGNVRAIGHLQTRDHNAFNSTPLAVVNIARDSMAENGWSPATRVFEAAGAGACILTDAWTGIGDFLEPGSEILVADDGAQVAHILAGLDRSTARAIGERARRRVLREHTYDRRAARLAKLLGELSARHSRRATA